VVLAPPANIDRHRLPESVANTARRGRQDQPQPLQALLDCAGGRLRSTKGFHYLKGYPYLSEST